MDEEFPRGTTSKLLGCAKVKLRAAICAKHRMRLCKIDRAPITAIGQGY